jgi:hypothetical protein
LCRLSNFRHVVVAVFADYHRRSIWHLALTHFASALRSNGVASYIRGTHTYKLGWTGSNFQYKTISWCIFITDVTVSRMLTNVAMGFPDQRHQAIRRVRPAHRTAAVREAEVAGQALILITRRYQYTNSRRHLNITSDSEFCRAHVVSFDSRDTLERRSPRYPCSASAEVTWDGLVESPSDGVKPVWLLSGNDQASGSWDASDAQDI